ncbi:MAG: sigma-70 family RNA polymerase sigma factor [Planctomycetia bacterium]|nr:sigma-70 family RNA polymerase sigma factor [Planctomycetia bacterium]
MSSEAPSQLATQVSQLCSQLAEGDESALERLFDLTAARLVRYAEMLSGRREDAEDALQVAMIKLARNPERLASADQPWAYFVRMVRNETFKLAESRRSRSKLVELLRSWASKPKFWFLPDDDWREQVQAAVKRLPPEQAEVVVLKIWEEMTFAEIAEVLGESLNTTASRYRYALEKLSRSLQPLAEEVLHG